jgi:preprotein translocase subunit SecF
MIRGVRFFLSHTQIRFIDFRRFYFGLSILLLVASVGLLATRGLNFGIDFQGGILLEVRTDGPADMATLRSDLSQLGLGEVTLQEFGTEDTVLIRIQRQPGGDAAQQDAVNTVKAALGEGVEYRRTETVGPQVSEELFWDGVYAVTAAMAAILLYIWFRFEWQFGVAGVIALVHDVITTLGLFALLGMEFNLSIVAAILTIAGYSINDTVVVFDRVRENLRRYKKKPIPDLLDLSVNQTLSRTVITGVTTLLALCALYFLGGEVIRGFAFAMIWGVIIGTYSSICIAVPCLLLFDLRGLGLGSDGPQPEDQVIEGD